MTSEHLDVLVVGAGLSGVGAGYRLQTECPGKTYAILEGRSDLGGTWDLFRYPGIRSDSDMFTLGYPFRPWKDAKAIADGDSILRYIRETAEDFGIDRHIRFDHKVVRASWSSEDATWTVTAAVAGQAEPVTYTCNFLYMCSGYYSYDGGYQPDFPGLDRYQGQVIHPQQWPEDLDYAGKRVVVIGSGATAVTLVPSMAPDVEHITMLQRSPSYITALPGKDPVADFVRKWLPERLAHRIVRWKNVLVTTAFFQICRRRPELAKKGLRAMVTRLLPEGYDVDSHFTPTYDPWDQRLCLVPDGDLFKAIHSGKAEIVTDHIESFTETGIALRSGTELEADIVVSATGLVLVSCGGIEVEVDGTEVVTGDCVAYKGHMLSGVPNFALCIGYTNASWTLRADLTTQAVCRLINHLDRTGNARAVPTLSADIERRPILDFSSGYIQRGVAIMPKQGTKAPWTVRQNYILDLLSTKVGDQMKDLAFSRRTTRPLPTPPTTDEPEPTLDAEALDGAVAARP